MAIALLIIFSALAITGYYFLANKLGFTQTLQWSSAQAAEDFFLQDYDLGESHELQVYKTCLCNDQQAALLKFEDTSTLGLTYSHGNHWVTYLITENILDSYQLNADTLELHFNDYATPKLQLHFTDAKQCMEWHAYLENLTSTLKQS